jgi:hypothetical protein
VTFGLAGRSHVDRMAPFVLRSKSAVATGGRTPITKAVTLPMAHPTTCVVIASATLASSNKMTVTILAR